MKNFSVLSIVSLIALSTIACGNGALQEAQAPMYEESTVEIAPEFIAQYRELEALERAANGESVEEMTFLRDPCERRSARRCVVTDHPATVLAATE